MTDKTGSKRILVTGANSGIGKALSMRLAKEGHEVIMLCRDQGRGEKALAEIKKESGARNIQLALCDLASLDSIREFVTGFVREFEDLDGLVNNAGVIRMTRHETRDGFESDFGVNHLGHFLLTLSLMPLLKRATNARIVIVSSVAHKIGNIHFDDIHLRKRWNPIRAYSRTKLANLLFGFELAERVSSWGISVNCLHPGLVASNIVIKLDSGIGKTLLALARPFIKTPEQGADTAHYLLVNPEVRDVTGQYYKDRVIQRPGSRTSDEKIRAMLWRLSEEMVGLSWNEVVAGINQNKPTPPEESRFDTNPKHRTG